MAICRPYPQHRDGFPLSRSFQSLALCVLLVFASGASCPRTRVPTGITTPVVFSSPPTAADLIQQVNANTQRVMRLQTQDATLTIPGLPGLRTNLALERPKKFRLRSGTGLTGNELDIGSNDEFFWMWAKRNEPPAVFFARHDQFNYASASGILPIPPHWLIETLGLVELDPNASYQPPIPRGIGQVELRTTMTTEYGALSKVLVIDDRNGQVLEQHIFNAANQLLASAKASDFTYEPLNQVSLPRQVEVSLPPAQLAFTLRVDSYMVNQLESNPEALWAMPQLKGYPYTDLTRLALATVSERW